MRILPSTNIADRRTIVASQLRVVALALAATTTFFGAYNLITRRDEASVLISLAEFLGATVLVAIAYASTRPLGQRWAHPLAFTMLALLVTSATLTITLARDPHAEAYVALFFIFASFVVLSWPWFVAAMLLGLGFAFALLRLGLPMLHGSSDFILIASGVIVGGSIHLTRLHMSASLSDAFTELADARAKAYAAEARMRAVFDASPIGLIVADAGTLRITQANPSAARMLGFEPSELIGMGSRDIIPEGAEREAHLRNVDRMAHGEKDALESDRRFQRRDGTEIVLHLRAVLGRDADGRPSWLLGLLEDVGAARRQEERLQQQARMLACISQAVVVTDLEGRIIFWNAAAERLYGWTTAEVLGKGIIDVTPSSMSREEAARIFAALAKGETWRGDFEVRRKDGSTFLAAIVDAPLMDQDGELVGVIGISEDVTERRRTEVALRRAERDAALATLVAGVAHEINNPLQFMGGHLDLMEMDIDAAAKDLVAATPEQRERVEALRGELAIVRRGLGQIAHITRALRQVARRTNGPRTLQLVRPLVDTVLASAGPRLGPDIDVRVEVDPQASAVMSGEDVMQVLLNLVLNAAEAMQGKGTLTLRGRHAGDHLLLEVEDNGPGIPPDAQPKLFTPFYSTKPQGTGLGLSISERIVKDHGGELTFGSRPGCTVFRVRLPARLPTPVAPPPAA